MLEFVVAGHGLFQQQASWPQIVHAGCRPVQFLCGWRPDGLCTAIQNWHCSQKSPAYRQRHNLWRSAVFIKQIRKAEIQLLRQQLHVVKRISRILNGVIGHDGYRFNAKLLEFSGVSKNSIPYGFDIGAMITDEHDQQTIFAHALLKRPGASVNTG